VIHFRRDYQSDVAHCMMIVRVLVIFAVAPLMGCGWSDQYSLMPKVFKLPSAAPPQLEPVPDTKALFRAGANSLFVNRPSSLAVSPARRNSSGTGFNACVNAIVPRSLGNEPETITLLVSIEHGQLADRRRATPQDGCATETYEDIDLTQ
jgi:hypothetical protein